MDPNENGLDPHKNGLDPHENGRISITMVWIRINMAWIRMKMVWISSISLVSYNKLILFVVIVNASSNEMFWLRDKVKSVELVRCIY